MTNKDAPSPNAAALAQSDAGPGMTAENESPGPQDKTDKWDREHVKSRVIIQDESGRFEAIDKAALAQSDAKQPKGNAAMNMVTEYNYPEEHAAFEKSRAQSDAEPVASGLIEAAEIDIEDIAYHALQRMRQAGESYEMCARWISEDYHNAICSRTADRSVHGELIPDCPTDGVAARQGNGG